MLSGNPAAQARAFDLLYNLSVHGQLLYPAPELSEAAPAAALADAGKAGAVAVECLENAWNS